jgi:hypothetical protein
MIEKSLTINVFIGLEGEFLPLVAERYNLKTKENKGFRESIIQKSKDLNKSGEELVKWLFENL